MISSVLDCTEGTQADTAVRRWSSNALRGAEAAARLLLHFARAASESRKFLLHIAVSAFGSLRRGGSYWPVLSASHCTHGRLSFHCARTDSANFYVSLLSVRPSLRCARLFLTMLSRADNVFKIDFIEGLVDSRNVLRLYTFQERSNQSNLASSLHNLNNFCKIYFSSK